MVIRVHKELHKTLDSTINSVLYMSESVCVNYLKAVGRAFREFVVITRPAIVNKPVKDNMKLMYSLFRRLSLEGIADVDFRRNTLFIKGDDSKATELLKNSGAVFVGGERSTTKLETGKDLNVIRVLFYRALSRYAVRRGFRMFWGRKRGKWRKLLPLDVNLEVLFKDGLAFEVGNDLVVYRGLYIMLEVFDDGSAILWVDLYSPIVKLSEVRPLSPREAKDLGLREKYTSHIPAPIKRFELTKKLLSFLCEDNRIDVRFADGYTISFTCDFPILQVMQ
jgi:hypothetical protein